jgi:hypothetical protein
MKPAHVIQAIILNALSKAVTYIEGPPGVGKSSCPVQAARQMDWDCIVLPPAPTIEPVDLRGALKAITKQDAIDFDLGEDAIGTTVAFPPDFLPRSVSKTTLIVIDDIPTAMPAVQAALFQLLLDRKLGNYIVPENVHFVLTGNRVEDRAGASRTLTALDSRVNRINLDVSFADWINWAVANDIAPEVIAFHRFKSGEYLWKFDPKQKVNPLPRTWEFLSKKLKVVQSQRASGINIPSELETEWYQGDVGAEAANLFIGFTRVFEDMPDPRECLKNPKTAKVPTDIGASICVATALSNLVTVESFPNLLIYLSRLEKEYEVLCLQDSINKNKALKETKAYVNWSLTNKTVLLGQGVK